MAMSAGEGAQRLRRRIEEGRALQTGLSVDNVRRINPWLLAVKYIMAESFDSQHPYAEAYAKLGTFAVSTSPTDVTVILAKSFLSERLDLLELCAEDLEHLAARHLALSPAFDDAKDTVQVSLLSRDSPSTLGEKVFIGHGHSLAWRDVKDFIQDRLRLTPDEYNRESTVGMATLSA